MEKMNRVRKTLEKTGKKIGRVFQKIKNSAVVFGTMIPLLGYASDLIVPKEPYPPWWWTTYTQRVGFFDVKYRYYWDITSKLVKEVGIKERLGVPEEVEFDVGKMRKEMQRRVKKYEEYVNKYIKATAIYKDQEKANRIAERLYKDIMNGLPIPIYTIFNAKNKGVYSGEFEREKDIGYSAFATIKDEYANLLEGKINFVFASPGITIRNAIEKDTTINIRQLGEKEATLLRLVVEFDTLNPWIYLFSPVGLFSVGNLYDVPGHLLFGVPMLDYKTYFEGQKVLSNIAKYSSFVEACTYKDKAYKLIKDTTALQALLNFASDSSCRMIPKNAKRHFTNGGFITLGLHLNDLGTTYILPEEPLEIWNNMKYWDRRGLPYTPRGLIDLLEEIRLLTLMRSITGNNKITINTYYVTNSQDGNVDTLNIFIIKNLSNNEGDFLNKIEVYLSE